MSNLKDSRVESLDYLRGLMALSVMFYHLTTFTYRSLDVSGPLGRLGVYAVSVFFILSGLSMAIVYNSYLTSVRNSLNFYIRRIFRIWPLLWVVCILSIIPQIVKYGSYENWGMLFMNLTTLFGFFKPSGYIVTGGWSLGNEMVYYALTPLIFVCYNYKKWVGNILFLVTLAIGMLFAFRFLNSEVNLSDQASVYINPFNNLFLYVAGVAIYYNFKDIRMGQPAILVLLLTAIILFSVLPRTGDRIVIVTGLSRIIFAGLSVVVVFCFYKMEITLPPFFSIILEKFGIATYGVYLLHPVIFRYTKYFLTLADMKYRILLFTMVVVLTFVMALYSYRLFEVKLIKLGKKLTSNHD